MCRKVPGPASASGFWRLGKIPTLSLCLPSYTLNRRFVPETSSAAAFRSPGEKCYIKKRLLASKIRSGGVSIFEEAYEAKN